MSTTSVPPAGLVPASPKPLSSLPSQFPEILRRAGKAAVFAAEEFFYGRIRNEHTRAAYLIAVRRFLAWAEARGLELGRIAPRDVGQYLDWLRKENTSVATRKQHLAAIRHFFDGLVTRHAVILNPALSVQRTPSPSREEQSGGSQVFITGSTIASMGTALQSSAGNFIGVSGCTFASNGTVYNQNGGQIYSGSDNPAFGNGPVGSTNGTITKF